MTTEAKSKLESYIRETMLKTGRFTEKDINEMVQYILSLSFIKTESDVNAFIIAATS